MESTSPQQYSDWIDLHKIEHKAIYCVLVGMHYFDPSDETQWERGITIAFVGEPASVGFRAAIAESGITVVIGCTPRVSESEKMCVWLESMAKKEMREVPSKSEPFHTSKRELLRQKRGYLYGKRGRR